MFMVKKCFEIIYATRGRILCGMLTNCQISNGLNVCDFRRCFCWSSWKVKYKKYEKTLRIKDLI